MSRQWGRVEFGDEWPSDKPVGLIFALIAAVVSTGAVFYYQYQRDWPFVERLYLKTYVATGLAGTARPASYYALPLIIDGKGGLRLPVIGEVIPAALPNGQAGIALTEWAVKHGAVRLEWQEHMYDNGHLHA